MYTRVITHTMRVRKEGLKGQWVAWKDPGCFHCLCICCGDLSTTPLLFQPVLCLAFTSTLHESFFPVSPTSKWPNPRPPVWPYL